MRIKRIIIIFFFLFPLFAYATMWEDPDFDEAIHGAGLICTGIVLTSSPQKTTIRLTSVFKGLRKKGDIVTIFRAAIVGIGHENDKLSIGDKFFFIVKSHKSGYIAFTDTYWRFPLDDYTVTLPIRDPSAYGTIKRKSLETFLKLLLTQSSAKKAKAFVTEQIQAIVKSDLFTKASEDVEKQIFSLEVLFHFGSPQDATFLTWFLNSPYYQVRWSCVRALTTCGGIKSKAAILVHLSKEENEIVQSVL